DGLIEARHGLVGAAEIAQRAAAIDQRERERLGGDRGVVILQRVFVAVELDQRIAAIIVRLDVIGLQRQRALETRKRVVVPAERLKRVAAIVEAVGKVGLHRQRALVFGQRLGVT